MSARRSIGGGSGGSGASWKVTPAKKGGMVHRANITWSQFGGLSAQDKDAFIDALLKNLREETPGHGLSLKMVSEAGTGHMAFRTYQGHDTKKPFDSSVFRDPPPSTAYEYGELRLFVHLNSIILLPNPNTFNPALFRDLTLVLLTYGTKPTYDALVLYIFRNMFNAFVLEQSGSSVPLLLKYDGAHEPCLHAIVSPRVAPPEGYLGNEKWHRVLRRIKGDVDVGGYRNVNFHATQPREMLRVKPDLSSLRDGPVPKRAVAAAAPAPTAAPVTSPSTTAAAVPEPPMAAVAELLLAPLATIPEHPSSSAPDSTPSTLSLSSSAAAAPVAPQVPAAQAPAEHERPLVRCIPSSSRAARPTPEPDPAAGRIGGGGTERLSPIGAPPAPRAAAIIGPKFVVEHGPPGNSAEVAKRMFPAVSAFHVTDDWGKCDALFINKPVALSDLKVVFRTASRITAIVHRFDHHPLSAYEEHLRSYQKGQLRWYGLGCRAAAPYRCLGVMYVVYTVKVCPVPFALNVVHPRYATVTVTEPILSAIKGAITDARLEKQSTGSCVLQELPGHLVLALSFMIPNDLNVGAKVAPQLVSYLRSRSRLAAP